MTKLTSMEAALFRIYDKYERSPVRFTNGPIQNATGENAASAAIFAFGMMTDLDEEETLSLFGEHLQTVLDNPDGESHENIRQFMKTGFRGLSYPVGYGLAERPRSLSSVVETLWDDRSDIEPESNFDGRSEIITIFEAIEAGYLGPVSVNMIGLGKAGTQKQAQSCCEVFPWVKQGLLIGLPKLFKKRKIGDYHDILPTKGMSWDQFAALPLAENSTRLVPDGFRRGTFTPDTAGMPNVWVNAGARVMPGVMVDAGATIGSCAYVGKKVHVSGKAGLGGVFEPLGDTPTVVGDHAFIGLLSEPADGVIVGPGAVMAANCGAVTASTRIYDDRENSSTRGQYWTGFIPHDSLAVAGTYQREGSKAQISCVYLVKDMDPEKRGKVSINEELRSL